MIKRSRSKIILEILELCLEETCKTRVVYQANLNFKTVNPYLDLLIENDLIMVNLGPRVLYKTTDKGRELLKNYDRIKGELSFL
jgi:predicted transcriptional regulator